MWLKFHHEWGIYKYDENDKIWGNPFSQNNTGQKEPLCGQIVSEAKQCEKQEAKCSRWHLGG